MVYTFLTQSVLAILSTFTLFCHLMHNSLLNHVIITAHN